MPFSVEGGPIPEAIEHELDYLIQIPESQRKLIYEVTSRLANEILKKDAQSVVFVDSSARPAAAALREYWKIANPDRDMPDIYFVNPFGFKTPGDVEDMHLRANLTLRGNKSLSWLASEAARGQEEINKELEDRYKRLLQNKDKPLLIVDTCAHSGMTLAPVVRAFREVGISDLEIVLVSDHECDISPNVVLTKREDAGCQPFAIDRTVLKHQGSVESLRTGGTTDQSDEEKIDRLAGKITREKVREAIRENFTIEQ